MQSCFLTIGKVSNAIFAIELKKGWIGGSVGF
uniref:Uncharacterized protein n=1 Tax=Setaria viridis TaxID=4556 RepID=A0A4U6T7F2_SETVI|nr:hypothetical protein SEVIR_9G515001v2 [Setaria viridis]